VLSYTPAIKVAGVNSQSDKIAAIAEEKEEIFVAQAFPHQAVDNKGIQIPDTSASVSAE